MSPQNWLCRSERNPALDTLALNSPLGHFNGDQRTPSLHQTDINHGDSVEKRKISYFVLARYLIQH